MRSLFLLAAVVLAPATASADSIRNLFGSSMSSGCYVRHYDDAHLAKHPRQRVRQIAFDYMPEDGNSAGKPAGSRTVGIAVRFRSKQDGDGGAVAYCKDGPGRISCAAEGDAGTFEVARVGQDQIRITMTRGLGFENETKKGYVNLADGPDDKVFLLRKAPISACDILR